MSDAFAELLNKTDSVIKDLTKAISHLDNLLTKGKWSAARYKKVDSIRQSLKALKINLETAKHTKLYSSDLSEFNIILGEAEAAANSFLHNISTNSSLKLRPEPPGLFANLYELFVRSAQKATVTKRHPTKSVSFDSSTDDSNPRDPTNDNKPE